MPFFDVTFIAEVVVTERIVADSQEAAEERANEMAQNREVGEAKLDLDWDIEEIDIVDMSKEEEQTNDQEL